MPNNKGFTLVELIATVTIMLLITTIAIPTSMHFINKGKQNQYDQVRLEIEQAADKYYKQHKDSISFSGTTASISLTNLTNLIDDQFKNETGKIIDPRNKEKCLTGNVTVTKSGSRVEFKYNETTTSCN